MTGFIPRNPDFANRVRDSFGAQTFMHSIGATITKLEPGAVDLTMDKRADLCQQHGFIHAGVTTAILDSAAGYAALSLFSPGEDVLTTEFKVNLLRPAEGPRFVARGLLRFDALVPEQLNSRFMIEVETGTPESSPAGTPLQDAYPHSVMRDVLAVPRLAGGIESPVGPSPLFGHPGRHFAPPAANLRRRRAGRRHRPPTTFESPGVLAT